MNKKNQQATQTKLKILKSRAIHHHTG